MSVKFEGRLPDESVNISKVHPLKEAATLFVAILALAVGIFFFVGWATEKAVTSMSVETEVMLLKPFASAFDDEEGSKTSTSTARVKKVFRKVADGWKDPPYDFKIRVVEGAPNAFAFPGGGIVVTTGLLKELKSENELAFILGHELGHFRNRDHIKGLSRQMTFLFLKMVLMNLAGVNASADELFGVMGDLSSRASGRKQEFAADEFGLELVHKALGHVGDTSGFFERRLKDGSFGNSKLDKYLSTHPPSQERIDKLGSLARNRGYTMTGTVTVW